MHLYRNEARIVKNELPYWRKSPINTTSLSIVQQIHRLFDQRWLNTVDRDDEIEEESKVPLNITIELFESEVSEKYLVV